MKQAQSFFKKRKYLVIALGVLVVIITLIVIANGSKKSPYQFVPVQKGSITETVSITGNTTSTRSVLLAFQDSGIISSVAYNEGDQVSAGDVIASLDTSDLQAQLEQAQANVDAENAKLDELEVGPTAANVAVSQANLAAAQQALQNAYLGVTNTLSDGYAKANDAVRNQLNTIFANGESNNPTFNIAINDSQTVNNAVFERIESESALDDWQTMVTGLYASSSNPTLDASLQNAVSYLTTIKEMLTTVAHALTEANTIQASTLQSYQADVSNALNEVDTASTNVQTDIQGIASDKAALDQSQAELNLTLASSTPQDIEAQQAQVEQAEASVASLQVNIRQSSLVSPINGVIATQDAKVGQIASPGDVLVSIISNSQFEVDAEIPEIDIGKVAVGDPVSMTLDAFPGQTFTGKLSSIDPAETVVQGVVNYDVKISFDTADPRIKSGLTVNCDIVTQTDPDALILPQYAVIQNDQGTFVETVVDGKTVQTPVVLGIQDENGNVEIASGVTEGEQVVNIGLKTP